MAAVGYIASRVVDVHVLDLEVLRAVDGESLDRSVLDVEPGDDRVGQAVGVEELGLGLATIGALSIPSLGTIAIDHGARRTSDGDRGSTERDKGSRPLLVTEGGGSNELNRCPGGELCHVKCGPCWHCDVAKDDAGALGLAGNGGSSGGECAAGSGRSWERKSRYGASAKEEE